MKSLSIILIFCYFLPLAFSQEKNPIQRMREEEERIRTGEAPEENDLRSSKEIRDALKVFRKAYKAERDKGDSYQRQERVLDPFSGLCVECEELSQLTGHINNILKEIPEEQTRPSSRASVDELIAVSAYTQVVAKNGVDDKCITQIQSNLTEDFRNLEIDDGLIIYQGEVDWDLVPSFALYGVEGHQRTVFLRGKDQDADKIIRVDIPQEGQPTVTLYQKQIPSEQRIFSYKDEESNAKLPYMGADLKIEREQAKRPGPIEQDKEDFFGFDIDYDSSGLPKKLTILDFRGKTQITESLKLSSDMEISSEDQEASVFLTGLSGAQIMRMRIEGDGDTEMAFDLDLPTGIVQTELVYGSNGAGAQFNMNHSSKSQTSITHFGGGRHTRLNHQRIINERSRLGLRYQSDDEDEYIYLEYKTVF